jgi:hypothetical protein
MGYGANQLAGQQNASNYAEQPARMPEVHRHADTLGKELERLTMVVCQIEERLMAVTASEPPQPQKGVGEVHAATLTPFGGAIQSAHMRLSQLTDRLNSVVARLEI